jgi:hypothetical protein
MWMPDGSGATGTTAITCRRAVSVWVATLPETDVLRADA